MKKFLFILFIAMYFFLSFPLYAGELDKSYSPTRKEWLEMSIFQIIKIRTDVWERRISSLIWAKEEENTIFITMTAANGEGEISRDARKEYIRIIKNDVEGFIKKYDWAKSLKVYVQFI